MTDALLNFPGSQTRHGTNAGWSKHQNDGEKPCPPCWAAKSAYDKRRLAASDLQLRNRLTAKAQSRALRLLAHNHPDEYRQAYEAFRDALLLEAEARGADD